MNKMTNHLRQIVGIVVLASILTSCENNAGDLQTMRLPACSAEGSIFEDEPFDKWATLYHNQVDAVVEAHLNNIKNTQAIELQCTDPNFASRIPASDALMKMAEMIPAWKDRTNELYESDMQVVLLEFLRVYECSMDEKGLFLPVTLTQQEGMERGAFTNTMNETRTTIAHEKTIARETLERTLGLVNGYDRLQPLTIDIECLKRSSLDLRNVLGLASDISSCLPRIWDAKGSLRDLKEE